LPVIDEVTVEADGGLVVLLETDHIRGSIIFEGLD
jgi:hypothetical protein